MYVFYLDLRVGNEFMEDCEGLSFMNVAEAMEEARRSARSLMAADMRDGVINFDQEIVIRDTSGKKLRNLRFKDAVTIVVSTPRKAANDCM